MAPNATGSKHSHVSTKTTSTLSTADSNRIRFYFKMNNLYMLDDAAYEEKGGEVEELVQEVVKAERGSAMPKSEQKKMRDLVQKYGHANESTFLHYFWLALIPGTRHVRQTRLAIPDQGDDPVSLDFETTKDDNPAVWTEVWSQENYDMHVLRVNFNELFARDSIPHLLDPEPSLAKLLEKLPRISTPKPDLAMGYDTECFTEEDIITMNSYSNFTELQPDLYHAFFAVEAKSDDGALWEAENQCCRAGAAMVHARQQWNAVAKSGEPSSEADTRSVAFTLALHPAMAIMFVHWVEVGKAGAADRYHMNHVESYPFQKTESFYQLRHDVHNVLDWGVLQRRNEVAKVTAAAGVVLGREESPKKKQKTVSQPSEDRES